MRKVGEGTDENRLRTLLTEGDLVGKVAAGLLPRLKELTETASSKADHALEAKFAGSSFVWSTRGYAS